MDMRDTDRSIACDISVCVAKLLGFPLRSRYIGLPHSCHLALELAPCITNQRRERDPENPHLLIRLEANEKAGVEAAPFLINDIAGPSLTIKMFGGHIADSSLIDRVDEFASRVVDLAFRGREEDWVFSFDLCARDVRLPRRRHLL